MTGARTSSGAVRRPDGGDGAPSSAWAASAWTVAWLAWLMVFGVASVAAVQVLLDPTGDPADLARFEIAGWPRLLSTTVVALGVTMLALVVARARPGLGLTGAELGLGGVARTFPAGALGALGAAYAVMFVAGLLEALVGNTLFVSWGRAAVGLDGGEGGASAVTGAVHGLTNAVSEEVLVLALPLAVMARLRWGPWAVLLVLVAMRLPYHLWHGPAAVPWVVVWTLGFWWLWRRVGSVWPFVVAHLLSYVLVGPYPTPVRLALLGVSLLLVAGGLVAMVSSARRGPAVETQAA